MGTVPQQYFDFVMDYAPYFYVVPGEGVDAEWGRGPAPAAHAIDFLVEAYENPQFEESKGDIYDKIVELANYLVSLQCMDDQKKAYGGFQSKDGSSYYYSIDAMRAVPALLRAYELTGSTEYLDSAVLAGETFLYCMQHQPSLLGVHDKYYGGFAQAVTISDVWLAEMHVIDLYGLMGLKMLHDRTGETVYQAMIDDALGFYRGGFEGLFSRFSPLPSGDGEWHRVGDSDVIYDDDFGYALVGLFAFEGYSATVRKVYESISSVGPSADYPAYCPEICWSGYVDVAARKVDSNHALDALIELHDGSGDDNIASRGFSVPKAGEWSVLKLDVGKSHADQWTEDVGNSSSFRWDLIRGVRFIVNQKSTQYGDVWVDRFHFGNGRWQAQQPPTASEPTSSQTDYGLRELAEVDEELHSDNECDLRAKALLAHMENPAETITVRSTVVDYGTNVLIPGDKVHVTLPNENIDGDYRIVSTEYRVNAATQTLELVLELGKETPLLADYMYTLQSKSNSLSRTKRGK